MVLAFPNSQAPRSPGGGASPARATPRVRPTGRAVRLEVLPPPPLCCPRTRPLPTFRLRKALRCLAGPFFFVTPGSLAPPFETRRLFPPLFLAIVSWNRIGTRLCGYRIEFLFIPERYGKTRADDFRQFLRRTEAAQCLQGRNRVRDCRLAPGANRHSGFSVPRDSKLGGAAGNRSGRDWLPHRAHHCLGVRAHTGRDQADRRCRRSGRTPFKESRLDLRRSNRSGGFHRIVFHWTLYRLLRRRTAQRSVPAREIHRGSAVR